MPDVDPAATDLPVLASLAAGAADRAILATLRRSGFPAVRRSHGYVLQRLVDETPTIGDLASRLGITQQAVSKIVAELGAQGVVRRVPDPSDARVRRVELTERGRGLLAAARAERARIESLVMNAVGRDDTLAAKRALAAMLDAVGAADDVRRRTVPPPED